MALSHLPGTEYLTCTPSESERKTRKWLCAKKDCQKKLFFSHCWVKRLAFNTCSCYAGLEFIFIYCVKHAAYQLEAVMVCYWVAAGAIAACSNLISGLVLQHGLELNFRIRLQTLCCGFRVLWREVGLFHHLCYGPDWLSETEGGQKPTVCYPLLVWIWGN